MADSVAALRAGALAGARRLALAEGLGQFPREIFTLADTLEVLDLSGNALAALPLDLHRLQRLRVLFCSDNRFTQLPPALGRCTRLEMVGFKANRIAHVPADALPPRLRWLILTDNAIDTLPEALGDCLRLQKLMLAGNRLRALPATLTRCTALELLRIAANEFAALPAWLPQLPGLAWLAIAGNPMTAGAERAALAAPTVPAVDWAQLSLGGQLGEGASGVIHAASWAAGGAPQDVALKLFKGAVTSDGWPRSEMAAGMAAPAHPHLIPVRGRVSGHPAGTDGLVLERIAPSFRPLAGPPSLQTCTRDVYADGLRLAPAAARRLARGVASALQALHAHGLLHGDLYAHNLLCDDAGDGRLGDFGAASLTGGLPPETRAALARIDVRAFGCLLDELVRHGDARAADAAAVFGPMARLAARCMAPQPASRPDADEIVQALAA